MLLARFAKSLRGVFEQQNRLFGTSHRALSLKEFLEQPLKEGETRVAGELVKLAATDCFLCHAIGMDMLTNTATADNALM